MEKTRKEVLYVGIFGDFVRNERMKWDEAESQVWAEARALGKPENHLCMVLDGSEAPCGVAVLSEPATPDDEEGWIVEAVHPKSGRKEKFLCLG